MLTRRRLLLITINTLVVIALLTSSLIGPLPLAVASAHALSPSQTRAAETSLASNARARAFGQAALRRATTPSCEVYPIALHTSALAGVPPGGTLGDLYNGTQPGNFGWLSWTGDPSEPTLVTSLTPPGNSETYVNPNDANDHTFANDKWVFGKPGVSNSKAVRDALTNLESIDITVPVWDQATDNGASSQYHIVGFAVVRLTAFQLPGANRITANYLGNTPCGGGTPPPPPGPSLSGDTLALTPLLAGPDIVGLTQTLTATLKTRAGAAVPDITIHFTITGANAQTTLATTDSTGTASITYAGDVSGDDSIQASATSGGTTVPRIAQRGCSR
jgi:hypothetical protein